jgi:hypothetical protein
LPTADGVGNRLASLFGGKFPAEIPRGRKIPSAGRRNTSCPTGQPAEPGTAADTDHRPQPVTHTAFTEDNPMKLKKMLLIGGIAAVGLGLVGGFPIVSKWMSYAKQNVQAWADENTPIDEEIKRLRSDLSKLDDQENKIKNLLAKEIAQCEKLGREKVELKATVEREDAQNKVLLEAIDAAGADAKKVSMGKGTEIDRAMAVRKLNLDSKTVATRKADLKNREDTLSIREENKTVLRGQLSEMQAERGQLAADLDALEVEYNALQLKGMKTKTVKDNTSLSKMRESMAKMKDKMAEKRARFGLDEVKTENTSATLDEIRERMSK